MVTSRVEVVSMGTLPKSRADGVAFFILTAVPLTYTLFLHDALPILGHSKTLVVPVEVVRAVGWKVSLTLQVPGPGKAAQGSKLKPKGLLMPLPLASWTL